MPTLVLGSFDMTAADGTTRVLADTTSRGNPVPIEVAVQSWLQDGAVVITQGHDNREVFVRVRFFGANLTALSTLEAALFLELEKPNTLTWTPDTGPATVFNVVTSSLTFDNESDEGEGQTLPWRTYTVRLLCEAFTRSVAEVTAPALPASGTTTTLVNAGSATTGWTGSINGVSATPSVVSGAVRVASSAVIGVVNVVSTLTTAIATSTTKYLQIDWKPESTGGRPDFRVYADGSLLSLVAQTASPTAGFTRSTFYVPAASIAALRLESRSDVKAGDPALVRAIHVDNINRTDVLPSFGTARQSMRAVDVSGSARTAGTLIVEHATNALGDVIVYAFPDGEQFDAYTPSVRQYRVAGGGTVTLDSTRVSGATDDIKVPSVSTFDVPIANVMTGLHTLVVRASSGAGVAPLTWTVGTYVNGTLIGAVATGTATLPNIGTAFANLAIGRVMLPTADLSESLTNAVVRVTIASSSSNLVLLDEAWLFAEVGQLVMVSCGTGTAAAGGPARRLFIVPPTVTRPRPTLWIGHSADRSDAYFPVGAVSAWQMPQFIPARTRVFVVTSNATEPTVTLKHTPSWHTNAAS